MAREWRLDGVLGCGECAVVYAASGRRSRRAAIRLLHPELSADETIRARFVREGYAANHVCHPAAISVLGHGVSEDGAAFLVVPLIEGETLSERLTRGPLAPRDALCIIDQLLDVLAQAHERGIFHRNLCPHHLMLTAAGELRVLGFGEARFCEVRQGSLPPGSFRGSVGYAPPEQVCGRSEPSDARCDVYAAGALLHVMLCGRPVHEAVTSTERMARTISLRPESIARIATHLPAAVVDVVDVALRYERERRWEDARAMQARVRHAIETLSPASDPSATRGRRTRSLAPWVMGPGSGRHEPGAAWSRRQTALVGLVALCGAGLSWSFLASPPDRQPRPPRAATLSGAARDTATGVAVGVSPNPALLCGGAIAEPPQVCDIRSPKLPSGGPLGTTQRGRSERHQR